MDFLDAHGLAEEAQVFPLSLLPGTAMRATAAEDGVVYHPAPPYTVSRTATFSEESLRRTLEEAEARLGRRLDEWPRPHLAGTGLDGFGEQQAGEQHVALWFAGDLFPRGAEIARSIDARLRIDPYATLDVVLAPEEPFPLDLLDRIRARLDAAPQSYFSRALAHRGEDLMRRVAVVLRGDFDPDWIEAVRDRAQVFREQTAAQALREAERLGADLPGARIVGPVAPEAFAGLQQRAGPDFVAFADLALEAKWQQEALGFGDAR